MSISYKKAMSDTFCVLRAFFMLSVPKTRTEMGKKAFLYSAPSAWNTLQKDLKLTDLVSLNAFKSKMKDVEADALICKCFLDCKNDCK